MFGKDFGAEPTTDVMLPVWPGSGDERLVCGFCRVAADSGSALAQSLLAEANLVLFIVTPAVTNPMKRLQRPDSVPGLSTLDPLHPGGAALGQAARACSTFPTVQWPNFPTSCLVLSENLFSSALRCLSSRSIPSLPALFALPEPRSKTQCPGETQRVDPHMHLPSGAGGTKAIIFFIPHVRMCLLPWLPLPAGQRKAQDGAAASLPPGSSHQHPHSSGCGASKRSPTVEQALLPRHMQLLLPLAAAGALMSLQMLLGAREQHAAPTKGEVSVGRGKGKQQLSRHFGETDMLSQSIFQHATQK